jgi:hypothetical protein
MFELLAKPLGDLSVGIASTDPAHLRSGFVKFPDTFCFRNLVFDLIGTMNSHAGSGNTPKN